MTGEARVVKEVAARTSQVPAPPGRQLPSAFFARPADEVAPDLIGKILWRCGVGGGRLVEVEAYLPSVDPACHSYRGRTARNEGLFSAPGHVYVYLSYGVHCCLNLVCDREDLGTGILIRALEPVGETEFLRRNRDDQTGGLKLRELAAGPGRVGRALGVQLSWSGRALGAQLGLMVLDDGERPPVEQTPRIGIIFRRRISLSDISCRAALFSHALHAGAAPCSDTPSEAVLLTRQGKKPQMKLRTR